jgi:hypothetical protein
MVARIQGFATSATLFSSTCLLLWLFCCFSGGSGCSFNDSTNASTHFGQGGWKFFAAIAADTRVASAAGRAVAMKKYYRCRSP